MFSSTWYNEILRSQTPFSSLFYDGPFDFFSKFEGHDFVPTKVVRQRYCPRFLFQCHLLGVPRDAIVVGSIKTRKGLEAIEVTSFLKDFGIEFYGTVCRENTGTTAFGMFRMYGVGSTVGSQKELGRSTSSRLYQSLSMELGLWNGEMEISEIEKGIAH